MTEQRKCCLPRALLIGRDADVWGYCDELTAAGHVVIIDSGDGMLSRGKRGRMPDVDLIVLVAGAGDVDVQTAYVAVLRQASDAPLLVHTVWNTPGHGISVLLAGASGVLYGPWCLSAFREAGLWGRDHSH